MGKRWEFCFYFYFTFCLRKAILRPAPDKPDCLDWLRGHRAVTSARARTAAAIVEGPPLAVCSRVRGRPDPGLLLAPEGGPAGQGRGHRQTRCGNAGAVLLLPLWISRTVFVQGYKLILFFSCTLDSIDLFGRMSALRPHRSVVGTPVGPPSFLADLKRWDPVSTGSTRASHESARDLSDFRGVTRCHTCSVTSQPNSCLLFYRLISCKYGIIGLVDV